jgi:N-acetylglucosamine-6-phosphate deacetylase
MIVLSGAELVLPGRILPAATLVIDGDRIAEIRPGSASAPALPGIGFPGHYILPGFIDVHVHGVDGVDSLSEGDPVAWLAAHLPRYGVTGFCPATVACAPAALDRTLNQVRHARKAPKPRRARVLPAHVESNFISREYRGAQPAGCLRSPARALEEWTSGQGGVDKEPDAAHFNGAEILRVIERSAPDVAYVTLAPELHGALNLVDWLVTRGLRVGLGHSAATYDQGMAAIAAGAKHATHLFNRMPALSQREPGLAGAVLQSDEVVCEIICDGVHVHPALVRTAVAAKHPARSVAITDGTALAGLPPDSRSSLGGQRIRVQGGAAVLDDGTVAGSVATMDHVLRTLVGPVGLSLVDAATMCATTPALELGLVGRGVLAVGAIADLVVLDERFHVVQTYIGGELAYARG